MMRDSKGLGDEASIDLAHEPGFQLGRVTIRPELRQLVRPDDGAEEIVEPRIMQVLVALAKANGGIGTRDQLTEQCWEGRIVGEDAINRAISRVRKLADGIGKGSFKLDTVTKVGYRLIVAGSTVAQPAAGLSARAPNMPSRRLLIGGVAAGALVAAAGAFVVLKPSAPARPAVSPEVETLMAQALLALRQATREGQSQSFGLYRRVVALQPDYADGWGSLGCAYAMTSHYSSSAEGAMLRERARAAGQRALDLDPGNTLGRVARGTAVPTRGNWLVIERALRPAVGEHRENDQLPFALGTLLGSVGRSREAAAILERSVGPETPAPGVYFARIMSSWGAGRLEDADRLSAEAAELYPTHFALWFSRFYISLYSGRVGEAIALGENRGGRPTGIQQEEFDRILRVARAVQSRAPADIDQVVHEQTALAHGAAGHAENAIQFITALGRIDEAFAIADAYYFSRGFEVPEVRFSVEQGTYTPLAERLTAFLFMPSTTALRRDPRFNALVDEIGLERYWRESGTVPDYRKAANA